MIYPRYRLIDYLTNGGSTKVIVYGSKDFLYILGCTPAAHYQPTIGKSTMTNENMVSDVCW